jgi:hypothetical protein
MRRSTALCLGFLVCLVSFGSAAEAPRTATSIIERYYQAIGGHERLKAIRTIRMKGTVSFGTGFEASLLVEQKPPHCGRIEFDYQGLTEVIGFNDSLGWKCDPLGGKPNPERLPDDAASELRRTSSPDAFLALAENGARLVLAGSEQLSGTTAWKILAISASSDTTELDFDAETGLLVRAVTHIGTGDSRTAQEQLFGDYRDVAGMRYPYTLVTRASGTTASQVWLIESIELDGAIPDTRFVWPDSSGASTRSPLVR